MAETRDIYITGCGAFLPGEPVDNEQIARRLGAQHDAPGSRARVLSANGIRTRHYAIDDDGTTTMLNEELAAEAVERAAKDRGVTIDEVGMLATGTTQGDLLVPGFASMVHGRLGGGPMELLSSSGVCASGMAAFKAAAASVRLGEHDMAVAVGSELVSRTLTARRFATGSRSTFDAEFLRWTLSDGAGAVVLEAEPRPDRTSLRVDWVHTVSYAHEHPVCMRAGLDGPVAEVGRTWFDQPSVAQAEADGMLRLRQDVRALPGLFQVGLREFVALVRAGKFDPAQIDHVLCHYSAEHFKADIFRLLREADLMIDEEKWFSNLQTRGNTGAASIFVMLEECWQTDRFQPGEQILLIVPESGRFTFAFALLTCVGPSPSGAPLAVAAPVETPSPLGEPAADDNGVVRWTVLELAHVWSDLERRLAKVPLIRRIETGTATLGDYQALLLHLRQQVVEGGRWISRAASNFSVDLFELRSAAIRHAAEEHRDYQLLEEDFCAVGGTLAEIRGARKNIGSEALSAFMFHQASQPDPVDLLGAMFVIEGLGTAKALGWARRLQEQLDLGDDQVRFLRYHGANDDDHFEQLRALLRSGLIDRPRAERIVRTAAVVARLYTMQLAEVDDAA
ncbi:3-oxoacyl-[acyl-carrier-protein] synthase-3 [Allocatelliglobosispora scoriae]|uniref:3-oxoacyl-[acyl-carrier-protein] synthase-3 n=1 Tax=Allocatelliglobosispora scoriae TaxID=643052 RepID=A0A841C1L3_9ACTN|nr:3-oxoacyl-[acyl-carrier-protein] synthase III C-terminal domain-containing protein [Allocatelliglobosispora scoriae]MBB5873756.1 3-oxoacyl-[acyl-carrier-protein] synthase-3 [Allocatelliglobosispora scoriae]